MSAPSPRPVANRLTLLLSLFLAHLCFMARAAVVPAAKVAHPAPAPLFRDPIYDGAAPTQTIVALFRQTNYL